MFLVRSLTLQLDRFHGYIQTNIRVNSPPIHLKVFPITTLPVATRSHILSFKRSTNVSEIGISDVLLRSSPHILGEHHLPGILVSF